MSLLTYTNFKDKDLGILPKPPGCLLCGGKYSRKCGIGIYNRGYPTEIPFFLYALCDKCLKKHKGNVESMAEQEIERQLAVT